MKEFIYYLTNKLNWLWLRFLIASLCELEVLLPLLFNSKLRNYYNYCDNVKNDKEKSPAQLLVPKNTYYCGSCPFKKQSRIAKFLFGEQDSGYCYYLSKGDFSFLRPTDLLWDDVKCCGINLGVGD